MVALFELLVRGYHPGPAFLLIGLAIKTDWLGIFNLLYQLPMHQLATNSAEKILAPKVPKYWAKADFSVKKLQKL